MKSFIEIGCGPDGSWGLSLLKKGYKGWFVEPHPGNIIELEKRLTRIPNALCKFVCAAIWIKSSIFRFCLTPSGDMASTQISSHIGESEPYYTKIRETTGLTDSKGQRIVGKSYWIGAITLAQLFEKTGPVDKIRIDVEGAEVPILREHEWTFLPNTLHVEFHSEEYQTEIHDILQRQGLQRVTTDGMEHKYIGANQ